MASKISNLLRGKTIGIVGAGNMGSAIIKGLVLSGADASRIIFSEKDKLRGDRVQKSYGAIRKDLTDIGKRSDVIILAVKPQEIRTVLEGLSCLISRRGRKPVVISIAAGVSLSFIQGLVKKAPAIRVMPNLCARIGYSVSAIASSSNASKKDRSLATAIFRCIGEVIGVEERFFDTVTAISGSGPAYFFLVFKALEDAGARSGLSRSVARQLAVLTAIGSARIASSLKDELQELISQVASKKGTTEAALKILKRKKVADSIEQAVLAAAKRSRELSCLFCRN